MVLGASCAPSPQDPTGFRDPSPHGYFHFLLPASGAWAFIAATLLLGLNLKQGVSASSLQLSQLQLEKASFWPLVLGSE